MDGGDKLGLSLSGWCLGHWSTRDQRAAMEALLHQQGDNSFVSGTGDGGALFKICSMFLGHGRELLFDRQTHHPKSIHQAILVHDLITHTQSTSTALPR